MTQTDPTNAETGSPFEPPAREMIRVATGARLHFGLLRFGTGHLRQFGGAGVMLDNPSLEVRVRLSNQLGIHGVMSERVHRVVRRWCELRRSPRTFRIEVDSQLEPHTGLGSGTQLALALTLALDLADGRAPVSAEQLAVACGRGRRSAVGTHGFWHGGLIVELGKRPSDSVSPLYKRLPMPTAWRVVLIRERGTSGLAGLDETAAFEGLPPVQAEHAQQLERELLQSLVPAVENRDFRAFCDSVYRYGYLAGNAFSSYQGSAFASPSIGTLVETCRQLGFAGAGQSSWGPTVFAFAESGDDALKLSDALISKYNNSLDVRIAGMRNRGAVGRDTQPLSTTRFTKATNK